MIFSIPVKAFCKKSSPKNNRPNQATTPPIATTFLCESIFMPMPIPIIGRANALILNDPQPIIAIIHGITVDPTFAPKSNHKELAKVRIPVFTKPIAKSVVAVEDCSVVVLIKPEIKPFSFVFVYFSRN